MATLLAVLLLVVPYLLVFSHIMIQVFKSGDKKISISNNLFTSLSTREEQELKKYASLFSLDSETDTDIAQLLEIGRKYAAFLGHDKMDEIVERIESAVHSFEQYHEYRGQHHVINIMMKAYELITAPSYIVVTTKTFGGDKDGEPTTSLY